METSFTGEDHFLEESMVTCSLWVVLQFYLIHLEAPTLSRISCREQGNSLVLLFKV